MRKQARTEKTQAASAAKGLQQYKARKHAQRESAQSKTRADVQKVRNIYYVFCARYYTDAKQRKDKNLLM